MKNLQSDQDGHNQGLLRDARVLYRDLTCSLTQALVTLKADGVLDQKDSEHQELVRKHHNALIQIIKLEVDLVQRSGKSERAIGGTELDLDAAREEIGRRLARLAAGRSGEGLSGQPEP